MENTDIDLRPIGLHWLAGNDPFLDCCVHGGIFLRIGNRVVSDGKSEWTVSTAAFNFLRTITHDHVVGAGEALIPCCGFNMWPSDTAPDGIYIPNCNNGIDWELRHRGDTIEHIFGEDTMLTTDAVEWAVAVCRFADDVMNFFETAWPKVIPEEEDRRGFELFLQIWQERRSAADKFIDGRRSQV